MKGREIMPQNRATKIYIVLMTLCAVLMLRVYTLSSQVLTARADASYNARRASVWVQNVRGNLYDRNLTPLLDQKDAFALFIEPQYFVDNPTKTAEFIKAYDLSEQSFLEKIAKKEPFCVIVDHLNGEYHGVKAYPVKTRYGDDQILPHVIGYTDQKGESGLAGAEKTFDKYLKTGEKTTVSYVPDAVGSSISGLGSALSEPKNKTKKGVVLTIDLETQKKLEETADLYLPAGAAIVTEVQSGDILAIVSRPDFEPGSLSAALKGENSEMLNRAFTPYNLGSIFKCPVVLNALSSGTSTGRTYTCTGSITVGGRTFACHREEGHGTIGMEKALALSCNPYFISLLCESKDAAGVLGLAKRLGLFEETKLAPGYVIPVGSYPEKIYEDVPAFLANLAIGQGEILASPIQVAEMMNTIASGGVHRRLNLFSSLVNDNQNVVESLRSIDENRVVSEKTAKGLWNMLFMAVDEGTGGGARIEGLAIAGKTSSAETGWKKSDGTLMLQGWFSGFFPLDEPKYTITVLAEDAQSGNRSAAPVFREMAWFLAERDGLITRDP